MADFSLTFCRVEDRAHHLWINLTLNHAANIFTLQPMEHHNSVRRRSLSVHFGVTCNCCSCDSLNCKSNVRLSHSRDKKLICYFNLNTKVLPLITFDCVTSGIQGKYIVLGHWILSYGLREMNEKMAIISSRYSKIILHKICLNDLMSSAECSPRTPILQFVVIPLTNELKMLNPKNNVIIHATFKRF